jgi:A/G-specific adenine glycosylase
VHLTSKDITSFQNYIYRFFEMAGRKNLPWRTDFDPYKVMVSEIMLQQTQVERVIPKFHAFHERFLTIGHLANASVSEVITAWQGLGYNRRGLNLQKAAKAIQENYNGEVPQEFDQLISLPGIGPYTAAAIQAFAFDKPSVVIETNIRTVFIFHFFHESYKVTDKELEPFITATLDTSNPRKWYSALMDYGSYLKQHIDNPSKKSKTYVKQSKFEGSLRQVRGQVLKLLTKHHTITLDELEHLTQFELQRLNDALTGLIKDGFIEETPKGFQLKV